jgi:hypothetical protein
MKPWLLKLRKVPLLGWLVAIIAVLIALLIWSVRHASYRERKLRVSMQISSTKRNHQRAIEEVAQIDNIQRAKIKASQDAQVGKLKAKAVEIRVAEKESNKRLAEMVNAMFKK